MNSKIDSNDKYKEDIFHYLGSVFWEDKNGYHFTLYDESKKDKILIYDTKEAVLIADPGYDASFKAIFLNKSERFINFLNSVFFKQNNIEIKDLNFLVGEFNEIGNAYNMNSLRADITCKGIVQNLNNLNNNVTLINVEVQLNWIENLDDRLFEYGSLLRNSYTNKIREEDINKIKNKEKEEKELIKDDKKKKEHIPRKYYDTIVIAFILDEKKNDKNSNHIKFIKTETNNITIELHMLNIIEINVFKEWDSIFIGKKNILFGKPISEDGKDWIKLISLKKWAKKHERNFAKYYFPKCGNYSKNKFINETIVELILGNRILLQMYREIEYTMDEIAFYARKEGEKEGIKQGLELGIQQGIQQGINEDEKKSQLYTAYFVYFNSKKEEALNQLPFFYKYTREEVYDILKEKMNPNFLDKVIIDNFINFLIKKNRLY